MSGVTPNPEPGNRLFERLYPRFCYRSENTRVLADQLNGTASYHVAPNEDTIPNDNYGDGIRLDELRRHQLQRIAKPLELACPLCALAQAGHYLVIDMAAGIPADNSRPTTREIRNLSSSCQS